MNTLIESVFSEANIVWFTGAAIVFFGFVIKGDVRKENFGKLVCYSLCWPVVILYLSVAATISLFAGFLLLAGFTVMLALGSQLKVQHVVAVWLTTWFYGIVFGIPVNIYRQCRR